MKIKCEVCGKIGYLQHIGKNYYRVKHYQGSINGKLSFLYHKQGLQYIKSILNQTRIDPIDPKTIDPIKLDSSLNRCGGWDSNPRRPSPEDLKSSPMS